MYGYQEPLLVVSLHFQVVEKGEGETDTGVCFASSCELCSLTSSGLSSPVSKERRGAWVHSENVVWKDRNNSLWLGAQELSVCKILIPLYL